ncbi:Uu.00g049360.m01.CDS01 [Anthostomella pinea]|uniref:Uu.00g049360.m01.CDS01 n=1 Tax=Anthostomella pinea TaxID=933095 RepID=A0AAI8YEX2_9PEZI|nr:Uu.00g049360.m01.CDS01 [Anthostomella pinea]
MAFERLVRFVPRGADGNAVLVGQPIDSKLDVGKAARNGDEVQVKVFSGTSVLNPGESTHRVEVVDRILSPLAAAEVGSIRCIGLNYANHAKEANMQLPDIPMMFMKPATALADPYPAPVIIPKHTLDDDSADYESELAIVIGKTCKNVSEADALSYVLGYTAANDVSSRKAQLAQSQACYSKSFDGSCPLGPVLVSAQVVPDPSAFTIRGLKNGEVMQESGLNDMVFSCAKLVSWLSQGTTLPPGTVILTGTPAGVGFGKKPPAYLHDGDEFVVELTPHVGSLYSVFEKEK